MPSAIEVNLRQNIFAKINVNLYHIGTECPLSGLKFSSAETGKHHGRAVSRFLVSNRSTNGAGCLRGLLRFIKAHFENISGTAF